MSSAMFNPWAVLGVHRGTPEDEVKLAYQRLTREYHPDRVTGDADKFRRVTDAYRILRSTESLKKHLLVMKTTGVPCAKCDSKGFKRKQISFTAFNTTKCEDCDGCGYAERGPRVRAP